MEMASHRASALKSGWAPGSGPPRGYVPPSSEGHLCHLLMATLLGPTKSGHRGGAWLGRGPLLTREDSALPVYCLYCGLWTRYYKQP